MATIIFDFDGTIADSFEFVAGFLERHARKQHPLTEKELEKLRGLTMAQMARHLGSPIWKLPWLFVIGRQIMGKVIYDVPIFEGMKKVIEQLHDEGHTLMIVSSNNNRNIRRSLKQHHLYTFFTDIYGNAGFFGKKRAIKRILKRNRTKPADTIYVGDEGRDVVAAHAAEVRIISAAWGFDQAKVLEEHNPEHIAREPQDIIRLIEQLEGV